MPAWLQTYTKAEIGKNDECKEAIISYFILMPILLRNYPCKSATKHCHTVAKQFSNP